MSLVIRTCAAAEPHSGGVEVQFQDVVGYLERNADPLNAEYGARSDHEFQRMVSDL